MAGPRTVDIVEPFELGVAVDDLHRQRAAERRSPPQPREESDAVGLDPLPSTTTIAPLSAHELGINRREVDGQPRREAVDEGEEGGAVRFAGGPVAQHGAGEGFALGRLGAGLRGESRPILDLFPSHP